MRFSRVTRQSIGSVAILGLLSSSSGVIVAAAPDVDGGWPRAYLTAADAAVIVYQPQIASWDRRAQMVAYAAIAYQAKGAKKPALGTVKLESRTSVSLADRL